MLVLLSAITFSDKAGSFALFLPQNDSLRIYGKYRSAIYGGVFLADIENNRDFPLSQNVHPAGRLLAEYSVPFVENHESICVDRERSCIWVASDVDTPKLYRIDFEF